MDQTIADFAVGDRVQHVFYGSYGTVTKLGRRLLHIEADAFNGGLHVTYRTTWRPTSVRKVG